jgi:hypothetical protein
VGTPHTGQRCGYANAARSENHDATAAGHTVSGLAWLALVLLGARFRAHELGLEEGRRLAVMAAFAVPLVVFGVVAETAVALGMGHFIVRVRPDLMPGVALGPQGETEP